MEKRRIAKHFLVTSLLICLSIPQLSNPTQAALDPGVTKPDDKTGYQIQLVYVETSSAEESDYDKNGQIAVWVDQLQRWLRKQIAKEFIFDTYQGKLDIAYLKFNGNLSYRGSERNELVQMYRKLNPSSYFGKTLAFVVDQKAPVGQSLCGWSENFSDFALVFPNLTFPNGGECKDFEQIEQINAGFSFEAQSILHEIIHSYGASHVCVDSTDLMQGSPECEQAGKVQDYTKPVTFDVTGRYYFGGNRSGVDLRTLKIWSDGSGQKRPDLHQGICWKKESCSFQENTFPEQGIVQLQIKTGAKWSVVNSVKGNLSNCQDCYKFSFKNSYKFPNPGIYQYRIVKLATKKFRAYIGRSETIRVLN